MSIWTPYTPQWTAPITNPAIGNGILRGMYTQSDRFVIAVIYIEAGSTTTFGGGLEYSLSLPIPPDLSQPYIGPSRALNSGVAYYSGTCETQTDGLVKVILGSNAGQYWGPTFPWKFKNRDELNASMIYQSATIGS